MEKDTHKKRLLFYLGHPAHYHLYKVCIKELRERSCEILIVIKTKDVLEKLLINDGHSYINIAQAPKKKGKLNHVKSFAMRLLRLAKVVNKFKPDILIGSAAELAILGKKDGIVSLIFFEDDLEEVGQFATIVGPLATRLICPSSCSPYKWSAKAITYNGYHELAYLDPAHFTPLESIAHKFFKPGTKHFLLRFAELTAYHDSGVTGINTEIAQRLIALLSPFGEIHITSERALEPQFEKYRLSIDPTVIHHLIAYADLYIGDSQTMAAEAAVLGTPAIRFNDFVGKLGYLEELEHKYQLTYGIKTTEVDDLFNKTTELLEMDNCKEVWKRRKEKMLQETVDVSEFMTSLIYEFPIR